MDNQLLQAVLSRLEALERRSHQMVVRGTISEVDPEKALAKVQWGPNQFTGWLPWKPARTGSAIVWWCPEVGEGVTVISDGDLARGEILPGSYTTANAAPSTNPNVFMVQFGDGAVISYDRENHALVATLPDEGTTALTSPGGITLTGNTKIVGTLDVSDNATVKGTTHSVGALSCDSDVSDSTGNMQAMRDTYNGHKHGSSGAAPPADKME